MNAISVAPFFDITYNGWLESRCPLMLILSIIHEWSPHLFASSRRLPGQWSLNFAADAINSVFAARISLRAFTDSPSPLALLQLSDLVLVSTYTF